MNDYDHAVRRLALAVVLALVVVAAGCGTTSSGGGGGGGSSSGNGGGSSHQKSVSIAKCRKLVGATMFRVEKLPFTEKYRNAIDSVCETPGLTSTNPADVLATAQVARQI